MASGHQNTPSNFSSRDDLVDPRWAFPNNLDSGKRRPKKQGNKGLAHRTESYGVPQPPGDKLNISLSEGDGGQGLPKHIHAMLTNDKEDNLKRVVTAQELELMLSILDQEQKDLRNKEEHLQAEAPAPKLIHPKEKLHHHHRQSHHPSPEAKANLKRFPDPPENASHREEADPYHLMVDQLYKDLVMFKRLTGHSQAEAGDTNSSHHHQSQRTLPVLPDDQHLQEKKNNVDLRFMDSPPPPLHNNYNSDQAVEQDYGAKNSLQDSQASFQAANEAKQKMLDAIKGRINNIRRILYDNRMAMQKVSHLEGKCMRHNNLNQFPARRHYEAEGRANEEPDLAANLVAPATDSDEELWEPPLHDKIKRLEKAKDEIQQLQVLASNNQSTTRQHNFSRGGEAGASGEVAGDAQQPPELGQKDLDYMQKQLSKIFRKLSNYQQAAEAKDNNLVYKQQQQQAYPQNNSSRSVSSLNSEEGNSSTLPASAPTATWGGGALSANDNIEDDTLGEEEDDDSGLANFTQYLQPPHRQQPNNCKQPPDYRDVPTIPKNQTQRNFTPPQPEQQPQFRPPGPHSDSSDSGQWHWFTHQVQQQLDQMASLYQAMVLERSPAPGSLLLLSLSQCYHMLYLQQMEIQHLQSQWTPPPPLNNQVPPRSRANNFWDNFRSYSCQNLLSSTSSSSLKTPPTRILNEHLSTSQPSVSTQNDSTIPKVPGGPSKPKNKKSYVSVITGLDKKPPPHREAGPSSLPTPSKDSSWAELSQRTGLNPSYLAEVVRQLQALPTERHRLQALRSLQDLATNASHPNPGPPSSTGAVRKDPRRIKQDLPQQSPAPEGDHPLQDELQSILARCSGRELTTGEAELYRQLTHAFFREVPQAPPPPPPSASQQQPRAEEDLEAEGDDLAEADQNDSLLLGAVGGTDEDAATADVSAADGQEPQGADVRVEDAPPQEAASGENNAAGPANGVPEPTRD